MEREGVFSFTADSSEVPYTMLRSAAFARGDSSVSSRCERYGNASETML